MARRNQHSSSRNNHLSTRSSSDQKRPLGNAEVLQNLQQKPANKNLSSKLVLASKNAVEPLLPPPLTCKEVTFNGILHHGDKKEEPFRMNGAVTVVPTTRSRNQQRCENRGILASGRKVERFFEVGSKEARSNISSHLQPPPSSATFAEPCAEPSPPPLVAMAVEAAACDTEKAADSSTSQLTAESAPVWSQRRGSICEMSSPSEHSDKTAPALTSQAQRVEMPVADSTTSLCAVVNRKDRRQPRRSKCATPKCAAGQQEPSELEGEGAIEVKMDESTKHNADQLRLASEVARMEDMRPDETTQPVAAFERPVTPVAVSSVVQILDTAIQEAPTETVVPEKNGTINEETPMLPQLCPNRTSDEVRGALRLRVVTSNKEVLVSENKIRMMTPVPPQIGCLKLTIRRLRPHQRGDASPSSTTRKHRTVYEVLSPPLLSAECPRKKKKKKKDKKKAGEHRKHARRREERPPLSVGAKRIRLILGGDAIDIDIPPSKCRKQC